MAGFDLDDRFWTIRRVDRWVGPRTVDGMSWRPKSTSVEVIEATKAALMRHNEFRWKAVLFCQTSQSWKADLIHDDPLVVKAHICKRLGIKFA